MDVVLAFTDDHEWLQHGSATLRELRRAMPELRQHAVVIQSEAVSSAFKLWKDCEKENNQDLCVYRVSREMVDRLGFGMRLYGFDMLKCALGPMLGINKYMFIDADISVVTRLPCARDFSNWAGFAVMAPKNALVTASNVEFMRACGGSGAVEVDNGVLLVNDAKEAASLQTRLHAMYEKLGGSAFRNSFTPGLVVHSHMVHTAGGAAAVLPDNVVTNWWDMDRLGATALLHHTGKSKERRNRVSFDGVQFEESAAAGPKISYSVVIGPKK